MRAEIFQLPDEAGVAPLRTILSKVREPESFRIQTIVCFARVGRRCARREPIEIRAGFNMGGSTDSLFLEGVGAYRAYIAQLQNKARKWRRQSLSNPLLASLIERNIGSADSD